MGILEPLQCLLNVQWHQKVHLLASIVPFDGKSAISFPFFFEQACIIFLHRLSQVLSVYFPDVFYPKVIDDERTCDWVPLMDPQPWRCFALFVPMFLQLFCQELGACSKSKRQPGPSGTVPTYLPPKMEGTKNGGNRIRFPHTSYLTTQKN